MKITTVGIDLALQRFGHTVRLMAPQFVKP
jgi:hypothetical protein